MGLRVITREEAQLREQISQLPENRKNGSPGNTADELKDDMMSTLAKYIPIPVLTGYTILDTIFVSVKPALIVWWMTFIGLFLFALFITYFVAKKPGPGVIPPNPGQNIPNQPNPSLTTPSQSVPSQPNPGQPNPPLENLSDLSDKLKKIINNQAYKQAIFAAIAFLAYVMALGGPFATLTNWQTYYGTIALVFASLFIATILALDME